MNNEQMNNEQREKLFELFDKFYEKADETCPRKENISFDCDECKYFSGNYCDWEYRKIDYLLENGVVVLPCTIGSTIYELDNNARGDKIIKQTVKRIIFETDEVSFEEDDIKRERWIFLTHKEAEKALKEQGGE